jgi:hypothetical protein
LWILRPAILRSSAKLEANARLKRMSGFWGQQRSPRKQVFCFLQIHNTHSVKGIPIPG